jgi:formylglycine-generating enzyme required for sulfatase activity
MAGNVCEWCADRYREVRDKKVSSTEDIDMGAYRVFRGGSWYIFARYCRSAIRDGNPPDDRGPGLGFRLARSVTLGP